MKRFVGLAATLLTLMFGSALAAPTAAFAHDQIVATTPADSEKVAAGTLKVSITFNEPVMNIGDGQGLEIQVTAPDGTATVLPCPGVDGPTLWGAYDAQATGTYAVDWRSVSSDGHANSGTFSFEVADGAPAGTAPDAPMPCARNVGASQSGEPTATPTATDVAILASSSSSESPAASSGSKLDPMVGLGIGIGLFVVLSILGALAAELQKRRRARKAELKKLKAEVEANPDLLRDL